MKVILFFMLFGLSSAALAFAKDQASSTIHVAANPTISPTLLAITIQAFKLKLLRQRYATKKSMILRFIIWQISVATALWFRAV